jgi:uroporphyrin-III C-methyltransferase
MKDSGFVFIVGAGPGDPDLITVKGLRALRQADIVLHDRLVDRRLLEEVRPDAKVIDVGKRKGSEDAQQARIHELMVKHARTGKIVCRLKGGDPFIFGRITEEIEALNEARVPFEVVPGLSSVTAVPASAGIALTQRCTAHGFMVITGSRSLDCGSEEWRAARTLLDAGGSVVVMMGLARVGAIVDWLVVNGCDPNLPAAIISRGTWQDQQNRFGDLRSIAAQADNLGSPSILVLGLAASFPGARYSRSTSTSDPDTPPTADGSRRPLSLEPAQRSSRR